MIFILTTIISAAIGYFVCYLTLYPRLSEFDRTLCYAEREAEKNFVQAQEIQNQVEQSGGKATFDPGKSPAELKVKLDIIRSLVKHFGKKT